MKNNNILLDQQKQVAIVKGLIMNNFANLCFNYFSFEGFLQADTQNEVGVQTMPVCKDRAV